MESDNIVKIVDDTRTCETNLDEDRKKECSFHPRSMVKNVSKVLKKIKSRKKDGPNDNTNWGAKMRKKLEIWWLDMFFIECLNLRGKVTMLAQQTAYKWTFNQGWAFSFFLFTIAMDELTREPQDGVPWHILVENDIVLVSKTRESLRRDNWMETLESKCSKINHTRQNI